jgi:hypothetical protein
MIYRFSIYELTDPRFDVAFYVGLTTDPIEFRLKCHIRKARTGVKLLNSGKYIRSMLLDGIVPIANLIEVLEADSKSGEYWDTRRASHLRERYWIAQYHNQGKPITNMLWIPNVA